MKLRSPHCVMVAIATAFVLISQPACALGAKCFMEVADQADPHGVEQETALPACHAPDRDESETSPEPANRSDCCTGSEVSVDAPKMSSSKIELPSCSSMASTISESSISQNPTYLRHASQERPPDPGLPLFTLHSILII